MPARKSSCSEKLLVSSSRPSNGVFNRTVFPLKALALTTLPCGISTVPSVKRTLSAESVPLWVAPAPMALAWIGLSNELTVLPMRYQMS